MSRIIAVASQKGGVGKTTTVLNLGWSLTRLGAKVLLVDGDPQGGLAHASALRRKARGGLVQALRGTLPAAEAVTATRDPLLALAGCGAGSPDDVAFLEDRARDGRLAALVRTLSAGFDYALVDAPAGVGTLVAGLLQACDGVLVPVQSRALAVRSLPAVLQTVRAAAGSHPLALDGVVVTMHRADDPVQAKILADLRGRLPPGTLLETAILQDERLEEASLRCVPAALLPSAGAAARAYLDLAMELRLRLDRARAGGGDDGRLAGLF